MKNKIGDYYELKSKFTSEDVNQFAKISGDFNPVHLNEDFAKNTVFKKRIVHGFLYGSTISSIIANKLPGLGSIYMYQDMKFVNPVYHNEELLSKVEIIEIDYEKDIYILDTSILKAKTKIEVLIGKAKIKYFGK
ncbi:MaoC family dehydratase [Flavobacterium sp. CS20]|uniref:MaoC family dehydratase n=1 Tax=Flavobacterium sp. CS20 TaxID=2775246 RepID=UPI001B3A1846|nr:MaoC family dehydratase [Flavobacterium sp. CS20]QTY27704.1 MaoC family dehydratase [Flavobacterium sp. CS20]